MRLSGDQWRHPWSPEIKGGVEINAQYSLCLSTMTLWFYDSVVLFPSGIFQGLGKGVVHISAALEHPSLWLARPGKPVIVHRKKERDLTFISVLGRLVSMFHLSLYLLPWFLLGHELHCWSIRSFTPYLKTVFSVLTFSVVWPRSLHSAFCLY